MLLRRNRRPVRFQRSTTRFRHVNKSPAANNEEPQIPVLREFGDAGDYWKYLHDLVSEKNRTMTESLDGNLELLLVFAALFSSVNSGFLSITLPLLSDDPAAQTNQLLTLLVQGKTGADVTPEDLSPPPFTPSSSAVMINRLVSVSLTCSLIASFGAVLGKQWLLYYSRLQPEGSLKRQTRVLQKKLAGVRRSGLRFLVEIALPSLLQIALFIFTVGFISYWVDLDDAIAKVNVPLVWLALAVFIITIIHAVWDKYAPFQTPISRFLILAIFLPLDLVPSILLMPTRHYPHKIFQKIRQTLGSTGKNYWRHPIQFTQTMWNIMANSFDISFRRTVYHRLEFRPVSKVVRYARRTEDSESKLDSKAVCKILETNTHTEVLRAVAENIPTINDKSAIAYILGNHSVSRLQHLYAQALSQGLQLPDAPPVDSEDSVTPLLTASIYGRALLHLSIGLRCHDEWFWDFCVKKMHNPALLQSTRRLEAAEVHSEVRGEILCQRLFLWAAVSYPSEANPLEIQLSKTVNLTALPIYIAASIKLLLHYRLYRHLSQYPLAHVKEDWAGLDHLEKIAFKVLAVPAFSNAPPVAISLVAWALGTLPKRNISGQLMPELYGLFDRDYDDLWTTYTDESRLLPNVLLALQGYRGDRHRRNQAWPPEVAYTSLLKATTSAIRCIPHDSIVENHLLLLETCGQVLQGTAQYRQSDGTPIPISMEIPKFVGALLRELGDHPDSDLSHVIDLDDRLVALTGWLNAEQKAGTSAAEVPPWFVKMVRATGFMSDSAVAREFKAACTRLGLLMPDTFDDFKFE